jgi:EAL domain-containing protein (putative c-di-GMP-specific phosphodiesterase class I)
VISWAKRNNIHTPAGTTLAPNRMASTKPVPPLRRKIHLPAPDPKQNGASLSLTDKMKDILKKIDDIVLKKVCQALAKWKTEGKPLYPISVNLSRSRLDDEKLIDKLVSIVDQYGVDHKLIDFELTESASYDNMEHMISVLEELRNRGFKISMDDFGTGYSSLSLLTKMPIDTLKIDKSFVDNVATKNERKEDIIVVNHIISLAKELGFTCLAEGAETKAQVDKLRELGCEVIQGYYYIKPIPLDEYEKKYL